MPPDAKRTTHNFLAKWERVVAANIAFLLIAAAGWLIFKPPPHVVALTSCTPSSTVMCSVVADSDVTAFATALATLGVFASLVAILGIRFSKVSVGTMSAEKAAEQVIGDGFDEISHKMMDIGEHAPRPVEPAPKPPGSPPMVDLSDLQNLPAFADLDGQTLEAVRVEIYRRRHGLFLTHLLSAPKRPGHFRAAIFVVRHPNPATPSEPPETIEGATMFLGGKWGLRKFDATWSDDGRLGVVVEAHGPFLILCEVRLTSGKRVFIPHYVEFSQHDLLTAGSQESP
ncbi:hypothetical protein AB0N24_04545 [Arthrobacter sp. NPDC093128]|uniref:hypothetical protein n=1 Tax=Arthrobacter sp. NPDC093128 TaxID=3154979 RepID=UPI00344AE522